MYSIKERFFLKDINLLQLTTVEYKTLFDVTP
jgi:hypothetical protein